MNTTQLENSFIAILKEIKNNLDEMCDSISPFTGNKHVIDANGVRLCLDTGYRYDNELNSSNLVEQLPDFIKSSGVTDDKGNNWYYAIIGDENFLLNPAKFDDEDPKKVAVWSLAIMKMIVDPTEEEMAGTGAVMLNGDWYSPRLTYFHDFTDAFIAYNIIRQNYSTPENVN